MYKSISDTVLFLDTETGGIEDKCSLLSVALIKVDENLKPAVEIEILIKHQNYILNGTALKVNGFNIIEHEDTELHNEFQLLTSLPGARNTIIDFVADNYPGVKPSIAAWNSPFDYRFIRNHIFNESDAEYGKYLGYRQHDISSIVSSMCHAGVFEFQNKGMQYVLEQLSIKAGKAHTALDDTRAMIKLYKKVLGELSNGKKEK